VSELHYSSKKPDLKKMVKTRSRTANERRARSETRNPDPDWVGPNVGPIIANTLASGHQGKGKNHEIGDNKNDNYEQGILVIDNRQLGFDRPRNPQAYFRSPVLGGLSMDQQESRHTSEEQPSPLKSGHR